MKIKKRLATIILAVIASLLSATIVLAAYSADITVVNTSGTSYPMLGANATASIDYMASNDFFTSPDGLDTRVLSSGNAIPHMLADDKLMFALPINNNESKVLQFTTDSSNLSSFPIIPGYSGYVTVPDSGNLKQVSGNLSIVQDGYFDTSASNIGANITTKGTDFRLFVDAANSVNATEDTSSRQYALIIRTVTTDFELAVNATSGAGYTNGAYVSSTDSGATWTVNANQDFSFEIYNPTSGDNISYNKPNTSVSVGGANWFAQTWTPLTSGKYSQVSIWGYRIGTPGIITLSIRDVDPATGKPTGSDLCSVTDNASTWNTSPAAKHTLTIANPYYIVRNPSVSLNLTSGEHVLKTEASNTFMGLGRDVSANTTFPISTNLTFNAPLWHNELSGSSFTAKDTNAVTANVTGATWSATTGRTFDNSNDKIDFAGSTIDFTTESFTILAWVYPTSNDWNCILTDRASGQSNGYKFMLEAGGYADFYTANGTAAYSGYTDGMWTINTWQQVGITKSGATVTYWKNGVSKGTDGVTHANPIAASEVIGRIGLDEAGGNPFGGNIGEVQIYRRDLSPAEISQNYYATKWKYDGSSGSYYYNVANSMSDTTDNWTILNGTVTPYTDNFTISVNGTQQLWFQPTTIISGTTLPDRSVDATSNNGTFVWGGNPASVSVTLGQLISDYGITAKVTGGSQDILPTITTPLIPSDVAKRASLDDDPLLPIAVAIETATNNRLPVLLQYWMAYIVIAIGLFIVVYSFFPNLVLAGIALCLPFGFGISQGIFDFWVIAALILWLIGCVIAEGRQVFG